MWSLAIESWYLALHLSDEPASTRTRTKTCRLGNMTSALALALALALADGLPNTEYRAPSTEHRAPSTEHRAPSTTEHRHRIPNTEHKLGRWTVGPFGCADDRSCPVLSCPVLSCRVTVLVSVQARVMSRWDKADSASSGGQRTADRTVECSRAAAGSDDGLVRRGPTPLRTR